MYIAEIISINRLTNKAKASLLGMKRPDGLWISVPKEEIALTGIREFNDRQLILIQLQSDRTPRMIASANDRLVECLLKWSVTVAALDLTSADISSTKESLEYQAIKFHKRDEELKKREEVMRIQEKKLESLLEKAQIKIDAAEVQITALTKAWKYLHYKEDQLQH